MRNYVLAACAALILVTSALVAAPPSAWRLNEGDQFYAEWHLFATQQLRAGPQLHLRMRELNAVARIRVVEASAKGTKLDLHIGHVDLRFAGPPMPTPAELLRGARLQVRLSPTLAVESIDGLEALMRANKSGDPDPRQQEAIKVLRGELSDWLAHLFVPVPAQKKEWSHTLIPPMTPGFELRLNFAPDAGATGQFTITGHRQRLEEDPNQVTAETLEVISERYRGTMRFDPKSGRMIELRYDDSAEVRGAPANGQGPGAFCCAVNASGTVRLRSDNPLDADDQLPAATAGTGRTRTWVNSLNMTMVELPPGRVTLGRRGFGGQGPDERCDVEITQPFSIGAHEVTIGQFRRFVEETGYRTAAERSGLGAFGFNKDNGKLESNPRFNWSNPGWDHDDRHPAVNLSWEDARAFCDWLAKKEGKPYRLPTEAEWEYAARAGTKTAYFCGDEPESLKEYGNIADSSAKKLFPQWQTHGADDGFVFTAPVGSYKPNAFGLYDMIGNALEWCEDWAWHYPQRPVRDPLGPPVGIDKIQRGGSFADFPHQSTCANRASHRPDIYCVSSGFRVALSERPPVPYTPMATWRGKKVLPREARVLTALGMNRSAKRPYDWPIFHVADDRLGLMRLLIGPLNMGAPREDFIPADEAEEHFTSLIEREPTAEHFVLRAAARMAREQPEAALADLDEAVHEDERNPWLRCLRAQLLVKLKRYAEAREDLEAALDLRDDSPYTHNALAWFLATCPDDQHRDGKLALKHAKTAYDLLTVRDGFVLDTLAAAYAETGDFAKAIDQEEEALKDSAFRQIREEQARQRLELFRAGKPVRSEE